MDIIKKLNEMRLERNLSVYRLAELSGLNQSTLANTFSRGAIPSIVNLEAMCSAMGVTLAQFFTDGEQMQTLTEKEVDLISRYRRLPPPAKQAIVQLVAAYNEHV